jgi:osmotically-inducible protein OsmY
MFLLDPRSGRARRARIEEKGLHARKLARTYAGKLARDLRNRAVGVRARLRHVRLEEPGDDETIRDRIRSRIGRKVRNAGSVRVSVVNGEASLEGTVAAREIGGLIAAVRKVEGVKRVKNRLEMLQDGTPGSGAGTGKPRARRSA